MKDCPLLRYYTYSDGFDILKYFLTTTKGKPEYDKYFEELMGVYDQLIKYTLICRQIFVVFVQLKNTCSESY